jgi:hypothetical protein
MSILLSYLQSSSFPERLWNELRASLLLDEVFGDGQISMKPRAIWGRSVRIGNWSTLLVMLICYPIILASRGLDFTLITGMLLHYGLFWIIVVTLLLSIHLTWIVGYFLTKRFYTNMLDFEILGKSYRELISSERIIFHGMKNGIHSYFRSNLWTRPRSGREWYVRHWGYGQSIPTGRSH